jgi:hypothetical protein
VTEPKSNAATAEQILDVFAYTTYCRNVRESNPDVQFTEEELRDTWQEQSGLRTNSRRVAKEHLELLAASGLSVRASDSATVRKRVAWMTTQPARVAYDLESEVAPETPATGSSPEDPGPP